MTELAILLFGIFIGGFPILFYLVVKKVKEGLSEVVRIQEELKVSTTQLNVLHNDAMLSYQDINKRILHLETNYAAQNFGKGNRF